MTDDHRATLDPQDVLRRLAAARAAFIAVGPRLVAAEPWPLAGDFGTGPEASWGPPEVLAHTAEMLTFWKGEFERLVAASPESREPVPFGRLAGDAMRLGILERDRTLPLAELLDRIDTGIGRWEARLPSVGSAELAARGLHPRDGEMPATWIRDQFVVRHLEDHLVQLDESLGS